MLESVSSFTALLRNSLTTQVASIPLNHRVVSLGCGVSLLLMVTVVSTSSCAVGGSDASGRGGGGMEGVMVKNQSAFPLKSR